MLKILIVEDAPNIRDRLTDEFSRGLSGYEVVATDNRAEAMRLLVTEEPNLVLLDLVIPPRAGEEATSWTEGRDVLRYVKRNLPYVRVIVLTGLDILDLARDLLIEEGADGFFIKDDAAEWARGKLLARITMLIGCVVCRSEAMQQARRELGAIRAADRVLVLEGEKGVGKTYLAGVIHRNSNRAASQLEHLTCAALDANTFLLQLSGQRGERNRAGLLASTEIGTLLLDGVDELSEHAQDQLARLLAGARSGEIRFQPAGSAEMLTSEVRVIVTLTDRARLTPALRERLDPARSSVKRIGVPPLRERKEDLPDLANLLLTNHGRTARREDLRFDPRCHELLAACDFVGNGAQLEKVIAAAVQRTEGNIVLPQHLDLPLPEDYIVRFSRGAGVVERRASRAQLAEFTDDAQLDLIVELSADGAITRTQVEGNPVHFNDPRLGRLLVLLMQTPGVPVDLKQYRRTLGIALNEPLKRYIFKLRHALGDTEVANRACRFITSHYGERYSFNASCRFAIIRHSPEKP